MKKGFPAGEGHWCEAGGKAESGSGVRVGSGCVQQEGDGEGERTVRVGRWERLRWLQAAAWWPRGCRDKGGRE